MPTPGLHSLRPTRKLNHKEGNCEKTVVTELIAINDKKFGLIQEYADNWGKMTNEQSLLSIRQWLDADIATAQLRQKYVPIVSKVLDGKKSATFFQFRSAYSDDDRIASVFADAARTITVIGHH